uniref:Laminin N-terminal domain-containing protein n=1 Tax=Megaselia scalaris TaxID=36166 RepID=T1GQ56_MEGSC
MKKLVILLGLLQLVNCGEKYLRLYAPPRSTDPCYTDEGKAQKCIPDFVNAAYGAPVTASSTCGQRGPEKFCDLDNPSQCYTCENTSPRRKYSSTALTDLNNPNNVTCWRSEILQPSKSAAINLNSNSNSNSIQSSPLSQSSLTLNTKIHLDNITLTLSLGKAYELTYVSLQFCPKAIKPDSLAILKSMDFGRTWQPFQYYSSQCRQIYGRPNRETIQKSNEQEARCTDSHKYDGGSNMARGSRIAFSTLEGRPSARDFDSSKSLQEWVTATDIRVIFHRLQMPQDVAAYDDDDDGKMRTTMRRMKRIVQKMMTMICCTRIIARRITMIIP